MTTSLSTLPRTPAPQDRSPVRLTLADAFGHGPLDGAWWPHTRDLQTEAAQLIDGFPAIRGRIDHIVYSRPDWDTTSRRIKVERGTIKAGSFPRDDTHVILLSMAGKHLLRLLVVPPDTPHADAQVMLTRAATRTNRDDALTLLQDDDDVDVAPSDIWIDDGGAYWEPHPIAPSYRTRHDAASQEPPGRWGTPDTSVRRPRPPARGGSGERREQPRDAVTAVDVRVRTND